MSATFEIVATNTLYAQVCKTALKRFAENERRNIVISAEPTTHNSVVVSSILDIPASVPTNRLCRFLVFTEGQAAAEVGKRVASFMGRKRKMEFVASEQQPTIATLQRLLGGYIAKDSPRIIDANWIGSDFSVLSHELERLSIPAQRLEKWLGRDSRKLGAFRISQSGSYVHWPHADAHFGWEQLRYLVDPAAATAATKHSAAYNTRYGLAIRKVRESHGLRQQDLGLDPRHVGRIERGEHRATAKALREFAKAHNLSVDDYLAEVAKEMK